MEELRYKIIEKSSQNEITETNFQENEEDAIKYLEARCEALDSELEGWKKERGFNSCIWSKDKEFKLIYMQVDGLENLQI